MEGSLVGLALDNFLARFPEHRKNGKGFVVLCPAHNDHTPSLYIEDVGDKILVKCRAGCDTRRAVELAGATMPELFEKHWSKSNGSHEGRPSTGGRGQGWPTGTIDEYYDYTDENNITLYQTVRWRDPKDFRQRRPKHLHRDPGESAQYIWNLDGVRMVLYNLIEVIAARRYGHRIYVTEGEKDAKNLKSLGLTATTTALGASSPWLPVYTDQLAGAAEVILLPHNDEPGRKKALQIRDAICDYVGCVKVLDLPDVPDKGGDVSDWIAKGGTKDQLEQLADQATPHITPSQRLTSIKMALDTFVEKPFRKPRSLLGEGLVSEGDLFFLYGRPGLGKTYFTLQTILELAQGKGVCGLAPPENGPLRIGVLELELTAYWLQQRILKMIGDGPRAFLRQIEVVARPELMGAFDLITDDWKALHRWCQESALDVLFIDALSRAHTRNENQSVDFGPVLQRLDDVRFQTGTAIGCIHHEPKMTGDAKERDDMDALRGSARMQSDPNTLIRLVKIEKGPYFNLRFPKANNAPESEKETIWMLRRKDGGFEVTDAPADKRDANIEKVRDALFRSGGQGLTTEELAKVTELSEPTVRKHARSIKAEELEETNGKVGRAKKTWTRWRLRMTEESQSDFLQSERDGEQYETGI